VKSRNRRRGPSRPTVRGDRPVAPAAEPAPASPAPPTASPDEVEPGWLDRRFVPVALAILLVAAALRLPELALNPFHHDEGINGYFTTSLLRNGTYVYDPANYHGPTLYYFALVSAVLFGLTTEAMRLVPVAFGLLTVALVFPLRRYIGSTAALTAAGLLAISPGAVYMSRYFIHESLLVAMSLALIVAGVFYADRRRPEHLLAAAAAAAMLFATKETGIITVGVLMVAIIVARWYVARRTPGKRQRIARGARQVASSVWIEGIEYRAAPTGRRAGTLRIAVAREHVAGAAVVFGVIYVLFYSSFFSNYPKGLVDSLATFTIWTQTGSATQVQPLHSYLLWMLRAEAPILLLGALGGLLAAIKARDRLWVFVGLWAVGIVAAYSVVQYKTPWITLNMLVPLALLGGLAVAGLWGSARWKRAAPLGLAAAVLVSGYQAVDLNYRHYGDETYPYVFVHSARDMLALVDAIEATAVRAGTGHETGVVFVTPDYWPLPWYMRDYPRAGFFGSIVPTEEAMIVANVNQEAELAPAVAGQYDRVGTYTLRPGVDLALYVRRDIARP